MDWKCPECGVDYNTLYAPHTINTVRSLPRRFSEALAGLDDEDTDALIRQKPAPDVWSALEYTAHVADILHEFATVVRRMNTEDKPTIGFWDPDEKAAEDKYNEQSKDAVLANLKAGVDAFVAEAEKVDADSLGRTAEFPWGERDLLVMMQNAAHEGVHHLKDAEKVLRQVRA